MLTCFHYCSRIDYLSAHLWCCISRHLQSCRICICAVDDTTINTSLGRLLKERGYRVTIQKFDPYINLDPGTMSPYQHGEVFVTSDGGIMAVCIDASDIVFTAKKLHRLSPVAAAALGRLLCGASMMGDMLKQKGATLNLRINGGGPLGAVVAAADSSGNVRGYVGNAKCPTEYYENGKINVAAAVGKDGVLNVMRDYGEGEPYIGQVPLRSGEIAEDCAWLLWHSSPEWCI